MQQTLALMLTICLGLLAGLTQAASVSDCLTSLTFDQGATDQLQLSQGIFRPVFTYNAARELHTVLEGDHHTDLSRPSLCVGVLFVLGSGRRARQT